MFEEREIRALGRDQGEGGGIEARGARREQQTPALVRFLAIHRASLKRKGQPEGWPLFV